MFEPFEAGEAIFEFFSQNAKSKKSVTFHASARLQVWGALVQLHFSHLHEHHIQSQIAVSAACSRGSVMSPGRPRVSVPGSESA